MIQVSLTDAQAEALLRVYYEGKVTTELQMEAFRVIEAKQTAPRYSKRHHYLGAR